MANTTKMKLEFEGLDNLIKRLNDARVDTKKACEKALIETHRIVTEKAEAAIKPHRRTGQTEENLVRDAIVEWQGDVASVYVGFSLWTDDGELTLASIFLMYGTPRMKPDHALYNAFFARSTKLEVQRAQMKALSDALREAENS